MGNIDGKRERASIQISRCAKSLPRHAISATRHPPSRGEERERERKSEHEAIVRLYLNTQAHACASERYPTLDKIYCPPMLTYYRV